MRSIALKICARFGCALVCVGYIVQYNRLLIPMQRSFRVWAHPIRDGVTCYFVTSSLIGWGHSQNHPCNATEITLKDKVKIDWLPIIAKHRKVRTVCMAFITVPSHERHGVSNYRQLDCLSNGLFRLRSKETSKLRITGPLWRESGGFPSQRDSNAESVSISRHYHV